MNTFKKIHTFKITQMSNMGTKYSIVNILPFSIFTSSGIYNNPRREALNWI